MAELSTIARPYAEALYRVAAEGDLDAWAELVSRMADVAGNPDMQAVISNPKLSPAQVYGVFVGVLGVPVMSGDLGGSARFGKAPLLPLRRRWPEGPDERRGRVIQPRCCSSFRRA